MNDAGVYANLNDLVRLKYQATGFTFLPSQPVQSILAGRHASRLRGRGLNFEELRQYQPGDDIRAIDWKATARMRKTHTRVYSDETDRPTIIVADQRINMFFGSRLAMKSVTAAEVAALTAWRVLDRGDRVGAIVFNDSDTVEIRPRRSRRQVLQFLDTLVRQNRALDLRRGTRSRPERLNDALESACKIVGHDCLVVLVSDCDGADDETERLIRRLARHNDVLVALIYDPLEARLPEVGSLVVSDGELYLEIDTRSGKLRQSFEDAFTERLAVIQANLRKLKIPVLPLHTAAPVPRQVRKLLGYTPKARRVR